VSEIEGIIPKKYGSDAEEIPGARRLLDSLNDAGAPWAIVTSGSRALVTGWINALNLPRPPKRESHDGLVTAEDVQEGKPDPACYALGRSRLFPDSKEGEELPVLVLEDAPAGIKAGHSAGCRVVALATSHSVDQLTPTPAEWVVKDLESVKVVGYDSETKRVKVEISGGLRR
jgi:glycerol 3-phosphatase-1